MTSFLRPQATAVIQDGPRLSPASGVNAVFGFFVFPQLDTQTWRFIPLVLAALHLQDFGSMY